VHMLHGVCVDLARAVSVGGRTLEVHDVEYTHLFTASVDSAIRTSVHASLLCLPVGCCTTRCLCGVCYVCCRVVGERVQEPTVVGVPRG
jgi:hypothetical protein